MRWTVLIPVKALPGAKSRLAPATGDLDDHVRLVRAIRADTAAAARQAASVARVVFVTDRGEPASDTVVHRRPGLDAAVAEGHEHARRAWPDDGVAALVGDLPALRAGELDDALAAAALVPSGYVPDAAGTGTTMLTAIPGHTPRPAFGAGSAARHARHARILPAGAGLRRDVDLPDDLRIAADELGVGEATSAVLGVVRSPGAGMICE